VLDQLAAAAATAAGPAADNEEVEEEGYSLAVNILKVYRVQMRSISISHPSLTH